MTAHAVRSTAHEVSTTAHAKRTTGVERWGQLSTVKGNAWSAHHGPAGLSSISEKATVGIAIAALALLVSSGISTMNVSSVLKASQIKPKATETAATFARHFQIEINS